MERWAAGRVGKGPTRYRIVVRGEIVRSPASALGNLSVRSGDGRSVITGEIVDQAHLHGVLDWLGDRGIEIVSVSPAEEPGEPGESGG